MARQDKLNNFAMTPTVNKSPVWTADSLQVGGTNLLANSRPNSTGLAGQGLWEFVQKDSATGLIVDGQYFEISTDQDSSGWGQWQQSYSNNDIKFAGSLTPNSNLMFSADLWIEKIADVGSVGFEIRINNSTTVLASIGVNIPVNGMSAGTWQRKSATVTVPANWASSMEAQTSTRFLIEYSDFSSASRFRVRNVKLEQGTIATAWVPAPEDIQHQIDTINAKLSALAKA